MTRAFAETRQGKITLDDISRSICLLDAIHDLQSKGQGRDTLHGSRIVGASLGIYIVRKVISFWLHEHLAQPQP